ncbi:biorientation of chromosomes in cell division protein 1-like 1 isoform X2 [Dama dama]|nr:biorientation of chromosomes in cell division protein 1-like 1 isoform X2 [Dama dama]
MSILETITSLNQEASAARASTETSNAKTSERMSKKPPSQPSTDTSAEKERTSEDTADKEKSPPDSSGEGQEAAPGSEELSDPPCPTEEMKNHTRESTSSVLLNKDAQQETGDQKSKSADKGEKKPDSNEKAERKKEKKEKTEKKIDHSKRSEDVQRVKDEKQAKDKEVECSKLPSEKTNSKPKTGEGTKEDFSLIDSDVDGLTDITVSSVHTSDLSSFEEDTEEEIVMSESMEEGEITSDDEEKNKQNKTKTQTSDPSEGKAKNVRHAYVHKPYLYSKYYSDSDDELTVEQRRQSIAKEKEERLLRRQINREKLEEKRKQKAEKTKYSKAKSQGKSSVDLEEPSTKGLEPKAPRIKEVLKERKVLEKKVALSKRRKKDSRNIDENAKKKQQPEEDSRETLKTSEHCEKEKASSSKDLKHVHAKSEPSKPARRLSESLHPADENKNESKIEREHKRRTSTPVVVEGVQEETDTRDGKRPVERLESGTEEPQKQKSTLKNEKHLKKDDSETPHLKSLPKKEAKSSKEKPEKEKTLSEDKPSTKHKYKGDSAHKAGDEAELHSSERGLKDENVQKTSQQTKLASDDKAERRSKHRNERKLSVLGKDGKPVSEYIIKTDENVRKENKKERHGSADKTKAEHKSRRSSDSKIQKDSLSSRQHGSTVQRRSESYSEDKCDNDSTNADSNSKPEEVVHKERRRTKSLLEEKLVLKTKSRSQGKQLKASETESQENTTKLATTPKPEKEKNTEEGDPERQRKSRVEDRPSEESGVDPTSESAAPSAHNVQRESGHRAKLPPAKERCKGDKESGATRLERRLSDGHKSRSLKHGSKDAKKKEDSKTEDKDGKEGDGSHEKPRGSGSVVEKKLSRRLCENRRGSVSQEMAKGEEKPAANPSGAPSSSSLQRPKKSDPALIPEQEPMEIDPEPATENVAEVRKTQDGSNSSQQDLDSENVMKQKTTTAVLKEELQTPTGDSKTASPACRSGRGTGAVGNSEKHADHRSTLTKKMHLQSSVSKLNSGEKESTQRGTHEMNVDSETSHCLLPHAPSESDRAQKNLKTTTKPTEERLAPGDATLKHSTKADPAPSLGPMAAGPQKQSHDSGVPPVVDKGTGSEGATASTLLGHHSEIPRQSWTVGESEVPRTSDSREGDAVSMVDTPAEASVESRGRIPEVAQAFVPHSRQGKADTPVGSESADRTVGNEDADKEGGLMDADGKGRDSNSKHTVRASVENGDKAGAAVDQVVGMNSDPLGLEQSRGPGEAKNTPADADRRHGHSEVDTSAGSNAVSSVLHQRSGKAETPTARPGREKASIASSTEGKDSSVPLNPVKAGTATTTSAEMVEGGVAVPCTSIEADEGLTTGMCSENHPLHVGAEAREGTVFAAAEEGGGVVTEGFAESETFLTSTKEGESGECAVAEPEERKTEPETAPVGTTGADARSVASEEKDDAVTSAGSEGKCDGSSGGDSDLVEGTVTFISEVESDGAVTSAGMDIREGSLSNEELDGFQRSPRRAGPKKESEGTVTCTGAGGRRDGGVLCSAAGVGLQEQRRVTGAPGGPVDTPTPAAASAAQEESASVTDGPEGESAVTSTGITEEDAEGLASCTGSEESGEGFALSSESEENEESAMDSTVAKDPTDAPVVAAGPGDDEGVVTSTGAKEDEDEGEGVVTSTGRGNEVGHASTCTGMEEESEGGSVCESAGVDRQLGPAAGLVDAEAGGTVPHANESTVDSVSGAEKDAKDAEICSSARGVVESSVSSGVAAEGVAAPAPEGRQGPMTSAAPDRRDSELSRKEKADDTTPSTGLVGGRCEALVSAAVPEHAPPHTSPGEREDEGVITSVENEDCDGLVAATASDSIANQAGVAGGSGEGKGVVISTSTTGDRTPQLSTVVDMRAGRSSAPRPEEGAEGPRANVEEFEAPMPSAASGDGSQLTAARNEEKDECAMISTSIGEEFEVPISSAAALHGAQSPQPVAATEDRAKGLAPVSADDFEGPTPSAPAQAKSPLASTSKEEKDECALISTSIAEDCEACVCGVATEREHEPPVLEEKDGSAIISTSSGEDCEGPVSSALAREDARASVTPAEETSDAAMISTSTSEGCEAVMAGALPQEEEPPAVVGPEDVSDAAIISTSTAECLLAPAGLDRQEEVHPSAGSPKGKDAPSATKRSPPQAPLSSLMAEDTCQCPGPSTGGEEVGPVVAGGTGEGHDPALVSMLSAGVRRVLESKGLGKDCADRVQREDERPEAGTAGGSTPARCPAGGSGDSPVDPQGPEQVPEGTSVSVCLTAVSPGAKKADDPRGPEGDLKTTTVECVNGQGSEPAPSHTAALPTAYGVALSASKQEQNLTSKSDHRGQCTVPAFAEKTEGNSVTKSCQQGLQVTVSSEENLRDLGSEESPSNALGGLGPKTNLEPEVFVPSGEEKNHDVSAPPGSPSGRKLSGTVELQREPSLAIESPNVENAGSETTEVHGKFYSKEEISNGGKDNTEALRCRGVEANPKEVEEEERHIPKRKRKKEYLSSEDELDDTPDVLDSKIETAQRQCSGTEPQDRKEESSGDLEELSKASSKTDITASRAMEEKDESSSSEAAGEKTEQNDDDTVKSQEEDQPVIIKRKRGRPRKHPVETSLKTKDDCKTDAGLVTVEQSPPGGKLKVMHTDEANKETPNLQERSGSNDDSEEKSVASVRRRGRKPKRSLTLSDDAESSEPERKRQKSVSEATEDKKDQESEEEEEEEEDEEPSGATTRSSTRSEAQRSKAQLSPSAKRKREASPPGARTRGQQRVEEAPVKKAKR